MLGDPETLGLDAIYPAFFLALMIGELRSGRAKGVAALGALIALALVPFTPPGVPGAGRLAGDADRAATAREARGAVSTATALALIGGCAVITAT